MQKWLYCSSQRLKGCFEIVKFLVLEGADIKKVSNDGLTPLLSACIKGHLDIENYLIAMEYYSDQHGTVVRKCKVCEKPGSPRLQVCSCCNVIYYCGDECMLRDWEGHSDHCERIKADYVAFFVKVEAEMVLAKNKWKEMEEGEERG